MALRPTMASLDDLEALDEHEREYIEARRGEVPDDQLVEDLHQYRAINQANQQADEEGDAVAVRNTAPAVGGVDAASQSTGPLPDKPSLDQFLTVAQAANPGVPAKALKQYWNQEYGHIDPSTLPSFQDFLPKAKEANPEVKDYKLRAYWEEEYGIFGAREKNPGFLESMWKGAKQGTIQLGAEAAHTFQRLQDPESQWAQIGADAGKSLEEAANKYAPPQELAQQPWYQRLTNKEYLGNLLGNVAVQSAPSVGAFMAGTVAGGPGVGAAAMFATIYFQQAGDTYKEAFDKYQKDGLPPAEAHQKAYFDSGLAGLVSGAVNTLAVPASIVEPFKKTLTNLVLQYSLNVGVDTADQLTQNLVAQKTFDPGRDPLTGVPEAVVGSGLMSAGETMGGIKAVIGGPAKIEGRAGEPPKTVVEQVGVGDPSVSIDQAIAQAGSVLEQPAGPTPEELATIKGTADLEAEDLTTQAQNAAAQAAQVEEPLAPERTRTPSEIPVLPGPEAPPAPVITPGQAFTPRQAPETDPRQAIAAERARLLAMRQQATGQPVPQDLNDASQQALTANEVQQEAPANVISPPLISSTPPIIPPPIIGTRQATTPQPAQPVTEPKPPISTPSITPETLHAIAARKGLDIESPLFRSLTKMVTGKEHLDDLSPQELRNFAARLEKIPSKVTSQPAKPTQPVETPKETQIVPRGTTVETPLMPGDALGGPKVNQPRAELSPQDSAEMLLRAEKAKADLEIAGGERGGRFHMEQLGHGSTQDVTGLKSATANWYKELTNGPSPLKGDRKQTARQKIETAILKIIQDEGVDRGAAVEKVKSALIRDREFLNTEWGRDYQSILGGEWPSWVPQQGKPPQAATPEVGQLPVSEATTGQAPPTAPEAAPTEAERFTAESIAKHKDIEVNPKVQPLVSALNKANIKTRLSGDAYGNELVYVDLDNTKGLNTADLPHGWKLTIADIPHMQHEMLGTPLSKGHAAQTALYEKGGYRRRIARKGAEPVSEQEAADLVKALTTPRVKEPKSAISVPSKEGQQEIPVPPPTVGERPIIGREATPAEAPLFSQAAQEPEAEQQALPETEEPTAVIAKALRSAADQIHKPKPKEKTETSMTGLEDVGQKIGGARKDKWAERGLTMADLEGMTGGEESKFITKANVWKPDYAAMVEAGTTPKAAALVKVVYDKLAAKPSTDTPEGRRNYLKMMGFVKDVYSAVKTEKDAEDAAHKLYYDKLDWGNEGWKKEGNRTLLHSVFKGRSDPFRLGYSDKRRAGMMVEAGFPSQEPWTRRYEVKDYGGPGLTPEGKKHYEETGGTWRVSEKSGKVVGWYPDEATAVAKAKALYAAKKEAGDEGKVPERPHLDELEREGEDYRQGKDVTAEDFRNTFGFRGVEFGNWAASDERQKHVNQAYDGLRDMAETLGIPLKALSLNGTLGIAFGARGGGFGAAHYEPAKMVINITKISGPGAMAHEWGHALDHYFGELNREDAYKGAAKGASGWYNMARYEGKQLRPTFKDGRKVGTEESYRLSNLRPEMAEAFDKVMSALFHRDKTKADAVRDAELNLERIKGDIEKYAERAKTEKNVADYVRGLKARAEAAGRVLTSLTNDEKPPGGYGKVETSFYKAAQTLSGKTGDYWKRPTEMFARSFEAYVFDRMGKKSDYLVHGVEEDRFKDLERYKANPYPAGVDRAAINAAYNKLFDTLESKETDKGTALFSRRMGEQPDAEKPRFATNAPDPATARKIVALNQAIERDQGVADGYAWSPDGDQELISAFDKVFGTTIVPIRLNNPKGDVFLSVYYGDSIFVRTDEGKHGFIRLAGHELLHQLRKDEPGLYDWFERRGKAYLQGGAERDYAAKLATTGTKVHGTDVLEEILADFTGDALADPRFLRSLAEDNPTKFRQFVNTVVKWLQRVAEKLRLTGFGSSQYFFDTKKLRDYLREVLDAYAKGDSFEDLDRPTFARPTPAKPFFSQVERVIESKMPNRASPSHILGILSDKNGIKAEEMKWLGLDDYLKTKESFSKEEVLDYVRANNVQVEEVMKGGPPSQELADRLSAQRDIVREIGGRLDNAIEAIQTELQDKYTERYPNGDLYNDILSHLAGSSTEASIRLWELLSGTPVNITAEPFKNKNGGTDHRLELNGKMFGIVGFRTPQEAIAYGRKRFADNLPYHELTSEAVVLQREYDEARKLETDLDRDYFKPSDENTKFKQWQLPGGSDYRELLLTLPKQSRLSQNGWTVEQDGSDWVVYDAKKNELSRSPSRTQAIRDAGDFDEAITTQDFHSSHWDTPNVLAHVRFNTRTVEGKKTLFLEEVQSDFGQKTRKGRKAIASAIDSDFAGIVARMEKAGVLTKECD